MLLLLGDTATIVEFCNIDYQQSVKYECNQTEGQLSKKSTPRATRTYSDGVAHRKGEEQRFLILVSGERQGKERVNMFQLSNTKETLINNVFHAPSVVQHGFRYHRLGQHGIKGKL
jgi:hypothetical protein